MTRILTIIALLFAMPAWAEYEHPSYELVFRQGELEIRDYEPALVVETQVLASRRDAAGDAFRILFNYISGSNEAGLEIPMTSPVAQTLVGSVDSETEGKWAVRFFLPKNLSLEDVPQPSHNGVVIAELKPQRYASVSFRGTQNDEKVARNTAKLNEFIIGRGYEVSGQPIYAFYDPPFIPWFLRENEILLPVRKVKTQ